MRKTTAQRQAGFSLLELLIVMALLVIVAGAILLQVRTAHQRAAFERTQIDLFQEAREFMDQMSRDLRQAGYPNPRNYNPTMLPTTGVSGQASTSTWAAVGLVYAGDYDLWFEGGLDDSGSLCGGTTPCVLYTQYHLDTSTTGGCPCLRRAQMARAATPGSENAGGDQYTTEIQNVVYTPGVPIFSYYANGGAQNIKNSPLSLALPLQWDSSLTATNQNLAIIDTVVIQLQVQSPYVDLKTGQAPSATLYSAVKINNCSQATTGQLSCAN
jgi:prepilin-type N-terminal cleavage/methylation domain-containing protein